MMKLLIALLTCKIRMLWLSMIIKTNFAPRVDYLVVSKINCMTKMELLFSISIRFLMRSLTGARRLIL